MKLGLALLVSAVCCLAQQPYEIRGTVAELNGGPLPDVTVTIATIDQPSRILTTDATGRFQITFDQPGQHFVTATKPGYYLPRGEAVANIVSLTSDQRSANVTLRLVRPGEITGRIVDDQTREPIPNGRVFLLQRQWKRGRLTLEAGPTPSDVKADANGIFRFSDLYPGAEYILSPRGLPNSSELLVPDFTKEDAAKTDEGYEISYWPGGTREAAAVLTAPLQPGASINVGNIYVRKIKQYRARVTIGACDGSVRVLLNDSRTPRTTPLGVFPCGSQILLRGLDAKSGYMLYATPNPSNASGIPNTLYWGQRSLPIIDRNDDVVLPLRPGSIAEGSLVFPKGASPQAVPQIQFVSTLGPDELPSEPFLQWEPDQLHFKLAIPSESRRLDIRPFGGLYYVKEIRVNGVPDSSTYLSTPKSVQRIEIVFDDQFAALNVTVMDSSRPVPGARIMVLQGPDLLPSATTGASGQTTIAHLQPGAYRFLAIPADQLGLLDQPRALDRVLASGTSVTFKPGETRQIEMRVTDLR